MTNGTQPSCALDVVRWLQGQGITPLPCRPKSKGPIPEISTWSLYREEREDDSFHVATPERCRVIARWWNNEEYLLQAGPGDLGISIDCAPGYNQNRAIVGIDVDTDALTDAAKQNSVMQEAPGVRGEKGLKLFFFIRDNDGTRPDMLQYYGDDPEHPALEVFTKDRHLMIYGLHPHSTPENPITYHFLRGYGGPVPSLSWSDVHQAIEEITHEHGLTLERAGEKRKVSLPMVGSDKARPPSLAARLGLRLEEYCRPVDRGGTPIPICEGQKVVIGAHPLHGSTGGSNLKVDLVKQVWYCHRCHVGGGVGEWLRVVKAAELGYKAHKLCRVAVLGENP